MSVVPTNAQEARNWNRLNKGEHFFPIRDWPHAQKRHGMSSHLRNMDRINYWTFLHGNGLPASVASAEVLRNSAVKPDVVQQMKWLERGAREGTLPRKYQYYDMSTGKRESFR